MGFIRIFIISVSCLSLMGPAYSKSQKVSLRSGELLIGEVLPNSGPELVYLRSNTLGEISISREEIVSIEPISVPAVVEAEVIEQTPVIVAPNLKPKVESSSVTESMAASDTVDEQPTSFFDPKPVLAATIEGAGTLVDVVRELEAPKSWSGRVRVGINASDGDSKWKESYVAGTLIIDPEKSLNFYRFGGSYKYRETTRPNGESFKSTDKYDADFTYRRTFLDDLILQHTLSLRVDQIKGIDRELQALLGLGYEYDWKDSFNLILGAGGGIEEFDSIFEDNRNGQNPVVNFFQEFSWKFYKKSELTQSFNYYTNPEDSDFYNYVLSAGIRFRLSELLGFEFSYNKEYDSDLGDGTDRVDTQFRNSLIVFF